MQLHSKPIATTLTSILLFSPLALAATEHCSLHGALLPKPQCLPSSSSIKAAGQDLSSILKTLMTSPEASKAYPWLSQNTTSFSIILTDANSVFYEHHHTAPGNLEGAKRVNINSVYRVGSVTKVLSGLLGWKMGVDWNLTIDKILPELSNSTGPVEWNKITLEMLVGHLSGLPRGYGFPEMVEMWKPLSMLGYPVVTKEDLPICNILGVNAECTRETLLKAMTQISPVSPPGYRPVYSNLAYAVLSLAFETLAGGNQTFEQLLQKHIFKPAYMLKTFLNLPKNRTRDDAVIPPHPSHFYDTDMGVFGAAGGLFSTPRDLTKLMQLLLSHEILDKETYQTFLRPRAMISGSKSSLIGNPWEIVRGNILKKTPSRITDLYGKDGGVTGYTARIGILEDYGVGFVITTATAGDGVKLVNALSEAVLGQFVDLIETETRNEAKKAGYVGTFGFSDGKTGMSIRVEEYSEGGLKFSKFANGKINMLDSFVTHLGMFSGKKDQKGKDFDFRLFPAGVERKDKETGDVLEEWRVLPQPKSQPVGNGGKGRSSMKLPSSGIYDGYEECVTWATQDNVYYGGEGIERVVFRKKEDKVVGVELPAFRIKLARV